MIHIKNFFINYPLLFVYTVVFLFLCLGVFYTSGIAYFPFLFCFIISLYVFYFLGIRILKNSEYRFPKVNSFEFPEILLIVIVFMFIGHLVSMNGLPGFECIQANRLSEAVEIRKGITTRAHPIWNYISSISIKALIPFSLVLYYVTNRKYAFWIIAFIGSIYAFILMQKSHILAVFIPLIILLVYEKKWIPALKYCTCIVLIIGSLLVVTNPQIRGGINDITQTEAGKNKTSENAQFRALKSITKRVFIVPGEMVSEWFRCIPEKKPFLRGNGYKIYSKLNQTSFHDYAKELYPLIRPELAKKGVQGSVNVASFMREYSNFGLIGLILSGFLTALFFIILELLFQPFEIKIKLSLNLFFVLLLSSGSLSTLLLSGGWFAIIFLFFVFKSQFYEFETKN